MTEFQQEFTTLPLAELVPADYNPRKISDDELAGLEASLKRWGLVEPIVWNRRSGRVVGGHQRLKVLADARVAETTVSVVDIDDNDERALNIALNNPHTSGDYTSDLQGLLKEIREVDVELFRDVNLDLLLKEEPGEDDGGEAPGLPDDPTCQLGEVWQLGEHRLVCGDASDPTVATAVLRDAHCSAIWTDPPYGIDYGGGGSAQEFVSGDSALHAKRASINHSTTRRSYVSNDTPEATAELLPKVFGVADEYALEPGGAFYVAFSSAPKLLFGLYAVLKSLDWRMKQQLLWIKNRIVISRWDYHPQHEIVIYGNKPGGGKRGRFGGDGWYGDDKQSDVWEGKKPKVSHAHPTMKPVGWISQHLVNSTRVGDYVYDPFGGSGSTLIACEQLDRRCLMVELEPAYCDVIIQRWEETTGGKAERL